MNAVVRFSTKGQIVIPKDMRDRYRFVDGEAVELVETADGVLLRSRSVDKLPSPDAAFAAIDEAVRYTGPTLTEADWAALLLADPPRA